MPVKVAQELSIVAVPKLYLFVEAARCDVPSIRGKDNVVDRFAMTNHLFHWLSVWQVEKHQSKVIRSRY